MERRREIGGHTDGAFVTSSLTLRRVIVPNYGP